MIQRARFHWNALHWAATGHHDADQAQPPMSASRKSPETFRDAEAGDEAAMRVIETAHITGSGLQYMPEELMEILLPLTGQRVRAATLRNSFIHFYAANYHSSGIQFVSWTAGSERD